MDPDAKVQVATLGTALFFSTKNRGKFFGKNGEYDNTVDEVSNKTPLEEELVNGEYTRIYGLSSTPDFGGQPNTIDTTTLDNVKAETSVLGLQPTAEVSYEINMMSFADVPATSKDKTLPELPVQHNLRAVKNMEKDDTPAHWIVIKASGVIIEYDATTKISYTADAQQDVEKFTIYHDVKSDIAVSLPKEVTSSSL